jgi:hypothetical protein
MQCMYIKMLFSTSVDKQSWEKYCHVYQWLKTGFGLVIEFINNLRVVITNNYYTIADLHNLESLHTNLLSLFPLVFIVRSLALNYTLPISMYYSTCNVTHSVF